MKVEFCFVESDDVVFTKESKDLKDIINVINVTISAWIIGVKSAIITDTKAIIAEGTVTAMAILPTVPSV